MHFTSEVTTTKLRSSPRTPTDANSSAAHLREILRQRHSQYTYRMCMGLERRSLEAAQPALELHDRDAALLNTMLAGLINYVNDKSQVLADTVAA